MNLHKNLHKRIKCVDILRGMVILIMMGEHAVHLNPFIPLLPSAVLDIHNHNPLAAMLRLISNICIPAFVLLCGASLYLRQTCLCPVHDQISAKEASNYAIKRGIFFNYFRNNRN